MSHNRTLGRMGEDRAAAHLSSLGFRILERNYRCELGEIDIVARKGDLVVFCEVKARSSTRWGQPCEAVGVVKQNRLRRLGARWLAHRRPGRVRVRFDVVSVTAGSTPELVHMPAAF